MLEIRRRKLLVVLILSVILFLSLMRYINRAPVRNFSDFHVNYMAGVRVLERGELYNFWKSGMANFKYPPFFAFLMMPLALLNELWASIVWHIINFLLLILCFKLIKKMIDETLSYQKAVFIYFATTLLLLRFILINFDEGQVNILMMCSLIFSIYFLFQKKDLPAAAFFGFSVLIKYMPLVLVPYFIFRKKFKFLFFSCFSILIYSFLPVLVIGWNYNFNLLKQFIPFLFSSSTDVGSLSTNPNQSLLAMLMRVLSSKTVSSVNLVSWDAQIIIAIFFCCIGICYLMIIINRYPLSRFFQNINFSLLFICIALFNLNAWKHAFIFLIFAYMVLLYYLVRTNFKDKFILSLLILSFILTNFTYEGEILPKDFFEFYSAITLVGILAFACLIKLKFGKTGKSLINL